MKQTLLPLVSSDLYTGTWIRARKGLVTALWTARAQLERSDLTEVESACIRERIRFVKEMLTVDPNNTDWSLSPRAAMAPDPEHLATVFPPAPEEVVPEDELRRPPAP